MPKRRWHWHNTAWVRADADSPGGLIYELGFKATDKNSQATCTGRVPVCVQDWRHPGACVDTGNSFDSTVCPH